MSYILDALKRADAERERGAVPGLHARQTPGGAPSQVAGQPSRIWLLTSAGLLLASLAAAGLWRWTTPRETVPLAVIATPAGMPVPPAVQPTARVTPPQPVAPVVAQTALLVEPAPPPTTPPLPSAPLPATAQRPARTAPRAKAAPAPLPLPATAPRPVVAAARLPAAADLPIAKPPAATVPTPALQDPPATAPVLQTTSPMLGELPDDIRRQIPILAISGSVYSENPAQRMLLVNNQVLTEGSLAAPNITLEQIQAKGSVFNFRGTRFRLSH